MSGLLFARPQRVEPEEKANARVEALVSESLKADLTIMWRLLGYGSESEFIRDLLSRELYGSFNRLQRLAQRALHSNPGNLGGED